MYIVVRPVAGDGRARGKVFPIFEKGASGRGRPMRAGAPVIKAIRRWTNGQWARCQGDEDCIVHDFIQVFWCML